MDGIGIITNLTRDACFHTQWLLSPWGLLREWNLASWEVWTAKRRYRQSLWQCADLCASWDVRASGRRIGYHTAYFGSSCRSWKIELSNSPSWLALICVCIVPLLSSRGLTTGYPFAKSQSRRDQQVLSHPLIVSMSSTRHRC